MRSRRGIPVPMADGTTLPTDHYRPSGGGPGPTVLVRSPVGRIPMGLLYGQYFSRHGFHVVVQETRDALHVTGSWQGPEGEREDGLATVDWLWQQPWFDGTFVMHGSSATGHTQWTLAHGVPECRAMSVQICAADLSQAVFPGGAFALESALFWCVSRDHARLATLPHRVRRALASGRPLDELDTVAGGKPVPAYQELLDSQDPGSPLRTRLDARHLVDAATVPVHMMAGWHDVFLPGQLRDYGALRAAGRQPYLTVGPWSHCDRRMLPTALREALDFFRSHLTPGTRPLRPSPVRLHVTGARQWRTYPDWPPPPAVQPRPWYLQPGGGLGPLPPRGPEQPSRYRYDPADPTPVPRGPVVFGDSRPEDCRPLEDRPDILVFTSDPLPGPLEVIGPVAAEVFLRSSREHTDCGVRLCDVHPDGASVNVCEGVRRLTPDGQGPADADGVRRVSVELWPVAHRFAAGHRLRVHLCSGGHPRIARHSGGVDLRDGGGVLLPAEQEVFHDAERPTAIRLPVQPVAHDREETAEAADDADELPQWAADFTLPTAAGPATEPW